MNQERCLKYLRTKSSPTRCRERRDGRTRLRARRDRAMADATARVVGTVRAKIHFFGINRAFSMRDEAVRRPERARSRRGKADASSDVVATRPSSTGDPTDDRARAARARGRWINMSVVYAGVERERHLRGLARPVRDDDEAFVRNAGEDRLTRASTWSFSFSVGEVVQRDERVRVHRAER